MQCRIENNKTYNGKSILKFKNYYKNVRRKVGLNLLTPV